ncbi:MAG: hypothetical protein METHP_00264 [Methanoregula sp. SKADARSKE-2]|nr:MAG: hypothetical protein METHP_00264 [Methanoregula sp. SKADARSKE-2]
MAEIPIIPGKKRVPVGKILIAAAIFFVIAVLAVPALAHLMGPRDEPATGAGGTYAEKSFGCGSGSNGTVCFFYAKECSHCHEIMPFLNEIAEKYPHVTFIQLEIWHNQTNRNALRSINQQLGVEGEHIPEVVTGTTVLLGSREIPEKLEAAIKEQVKRKTYGS